MVGSLLVEAESDGQRAWFTAALALSLVGDVALLGRERWFGAGLAAFLVAHLAYVAGLLGEPGPGDSWVLGVVFVVVGGWLAGRPIVSGALRRRGPVLAAAVVAYLLAISATVVAAGTSGDAVARAGAIALYASDGILGWNRFVRPVPRGRLLTRVPYHAGQALMVVSLVV